MAQLHRRVVSALVVSPTCVEKLSTDVPGTSDRGRRVEDDGVGLIGTGANCVSCIEVKTTEFWGIMGTPFSVGKRPNSLKISAILALVCSSNIDLFRASVCYADLRENRYASIRPALLSSAMAIVSIGIAQERIKSELQCPVETSSGSQSRGKFDSGVVGLQRMTGRIH